MPDLRHKNEQNIQNILPETLENIKNAWVQKLQLCVSVLQNTIEVISNNYKKKKYNELFSFLCNKIFFFLFTIKFKKYYLNFNFNLF